jgi:hypothetical protein
MVVDIITSTKISTVYHYETDTKTLETTLSTVVVDTLLQPRKLVELTTLACLARLNPLSSISSISCGCLGITPATVPAVATVTVTVPARLYFD